MVRDAAVTGGPLGGFYWTAVHGGMAHASTQVSQTTRACSFEKFIDLRAPRAIPGRSPSPASVLSRKNVHLRASPAPAPILGLPSAGFHAGVHLWLAPTPAPISPNIDTRLLPPERPSSRRPNTGANSGRSLPPGASIFAQDVHIFGTRANSGRPLSPPGASTFGPGADSGRRVAHPFTAASSPGHIRCSRTPQAPSGAGRRLPRRGPEHAASPPGV
jgi:hypothetical protein